ncbi:MAG: response regulator [Cyanobacteriota bacterium]|nr:response regulator [Cyanobacteriota bacterium]
MSRRSTLLLSSLSDRLFSLKRDCFSGQMILTGSQSYTFHFHLGRLLYANGGPHRVRRWRRCLAAYCPNLQLETIQLPTNLSDAVSNSLGVCWEYELLCWWLERRWIGREQVTALIQAALQEVLLEVSLLAWSDLKLIPQESPFSTHPVLLDPEVLFAGLPQQIQRWQERGLAHCYPWQAPILCPSQIEVGQDWSTLPWAEGLDGQQTFFDLARSFNQDIADLGSSLAPYLQSGQIEVVTLPDLPDPIPPISRDSCPAILVACIDEDRWVCQSLEILLTRTGHRVVTFQDPLRAIRQLMQQKPDVILVNLELPHLSGYELVTQLRKQPHFSETPMIALSSSDGIVNRFRAKMVGCYDFMAKPIDPKLLLSTMAKALSEKAASQPATHHS